MVCVIGKTCCGKDSLVNKLISLHGYKKLISYTTRPMRKGEKQDITYHFIDQEEFQKKIAEGFFCRMENIRYRRGYLVLRNCFKRLRGSR